jgi:hypothetical protein
VNIPCRTIPCLTFVIISVAFVIAEVEASDLDSLKDSTQNFQHLTKSKLKITARAHSQGVFNYAGVIANDNPAFDMTATYDRKQWGCLFLKAIDLRDLHSPYNFSLALLYKNIHVGSKLTITPYAGFVIEQTEKIVGRESDGMIIILTSIKLTPKLTLEHCGRFSNTFFQPVACSLLAQTSRFDRQWLAQ